jgi:hypothetical protein
MDNIKEQCGERSERDELVQVIRVSGCFITDE